MLYSIDNPQQTRTGHTALIAPPLTVIMIFCFVLVLVQPQPSRTSRVPAASNQSPSTAPAPQPALPSLTFAPATPLPTLASSTTTATPQASPAMEGKLLQAASSNSQQTGTSLQIVVPKPIAATNLLNNTKDSGKKDRH